VAQCPGVRRVRLGEARINGALSSEIVRRVVQRHVEELRQCYEREPGAAARRAGSLRIVFSVSPEGQVQAAKVEGSTLDAAGLDGCLVKSVGGWIFPAPAQGSVEVSYPLFFEAG
jgi:TonB family protein